MKRLQRIATESLIIAGLMWSGSAMLAQTTIGGAPTGGGTAQTPSAQSQPGTAQPNSPSSAQQPNSTTPNQQPNSATPNQQPNSTTPNANYPSQQAPVAPGQSIPAEQMPPTEQAPPPVDQASPSQQGTPNTNQTISPSTTPNSQQTTPGQQPPSQVTPPQDQTPPPHASLDQGPAGNVTMVEEPAQSASASPNLSQQVYDSLAKDKSLAKAACNVKVTSMNGTVTLQGDVPTQEAKKAIGAKANEIALDLGATTVVNELSVSPQQN